MARPLQIVATGDSENDSFALQTENLSSILSKVPQGTKVAVVSVVGAFRTGKSFLLNFFLRYLRCSVNADDLSEDWMTVDGQELFEGNMNDRTPHGGENKDMKSFAWRGGQERQTTGIWMWSEPFLRTPKGSNEQVAVLLMDTQGMFDNETSMALTAQIFGLSTFVSSFQIYNVEKRIQEDNLQHLALFAEYGRIAVAPKGTDSPVLVPVSPPVEGQVTVNAVPVEHAAEEVRTKPFQRLQFLVRDWPNFDADWEDDSSESHLKANDIDIGLENEDDEMVMVGREKDENSKSTRDGKDVVFSKLRAEMKTYLRDVIKDRGLSDLQSTREQISRCFDTVDCFLLPHPGLHVEKKNFSGSIPQIGSFFRGMVNRYTRLIFDDELEPKVVHRRAITAPELMTYFEVYVKMFQAGNKSFPKAMTMLDATTEASNRNAQDLALNMYKSRMGTVLTGSGGRVPFLKESMLFNHHEESLSAALAEFKSIATMGLEGSVSKARVVLCERIEAERVRCFELNAMRNPFKDLEMYAVPVVVASMGWMMATVTDVTCSHDICEVAESSFKNIYLFCAFGLLCLALRYPFTDIIMYTVPLIIALVTWLSATVINVSCSSIACKKTEDALKKVYLYILFSTLVLAWKNFAGSYSHMKELLPVLINAVGSGAGGGGGDGEAGGGPGKKTR